MLSNILRWKEQLVDRDCVNRLLSVTSPPAVCIALHVLHLQLPYLILQLGPLGADRACRTLSRRWARRQL